MNKTDIVHAIVQRTDNEKITKSLVNEILTLQEELFVETLQKGGKIQLIGLFSIEPKVRSPRKGFNPLNNQEFDIEAKMGLKVQLGSRLKKAVENLSVSDYVKK